MLAASTPNELLLSGAVRHPLEQRGFGVDVHYAEFALSSSHEVFS
jgi:hypothetical protein